MLNCATCSSMAHVRRPLTRFHEYYSVESAAAFTADFWVNAPVVDDVDVDGPDDAASDDATTGDTDNHDGDTEPASESEST